MKQELNKKLQRVSDRLRVWHEQFFEDKGKKSEKNDLDSPNFSPKIQPRRLTRENLSLSEDKNKSSTESYFSPSKRLSIVPQQSTENIKGKFFPITL